MLLFLVEAEEPVALRVLCASAEDEARLALSLERREELVAEIWRRGRVTGLARSPQSVTARR